MADAARQDKLALAVHDGNPGALERLVRIYQDGLFSFALRLLRDPFEAQEVTQDAFLRAHRALTMRYDRQKCIELALKPWLFRIVHNLAYNRIRALGSTAARAPAQLDRVSDLKAHPSLQPDQGLESEELHLSLQRALHELTWPDRRLIILRFIEEMTYGEIAGVVGGTEAAVRGCVYRALRRLRALLAREEGRWTVKR